MSEMSRWTAKSYLVINNMMLYFVKVGIYLDFLNQPEPVFPDENWLSNTLGAGVCPRCKCIDRKRYPAPVDIVLEKAPENQTLAMIETTNITVWRKAFVEKLLQHQSGFAVGKCLTSTGKVIDDYVTCYMKKFITIRSNKQSLYQICPACGAIISNIEPGPKYVLEKEINGSRIYQDALCRFYVTEEIVDNFSLREMQGDFSFDAISIRQSPADGKRLPGDP
jgi:hypothetical protein